MVCCCRRRRAQSGSLQAGRRHAVRRRVLQQPGRHPGLPSHVPGYHPAEPGQVLGGQLPPDSAGAGIHFHMPQGPDLDGPEGREIAAAEAAKGLEALPHMAEIWPLGGLPPCLAGLNVYKPDVRASRKQGGSVRNNSYTRYALSRWYSNRLESALLQGLHPSPRVISNEEQSLQHTIALLTASLEGGILASPSAL